MNDEPMYRRIAGDLRRQITTGDLPPGAPVPGEVALGRAYGVTRVTARHALRLVEQEGLITGGREKTVARREPIPVTITRTGTGWAGESPTAGADSWGAAVLAAGHVPSQQIDVLIRGADSESAARLNLTPGHLLTVRRLIRYADGEPHNMITFWFPADIATGTPITRPESIAEGSVAWLESKMGPLEHQWEASTRMPTPEETETLAIPGGVPVLEVWRASTADGRPVVVSRAIYPGDRAKLAG